MLDNIHAHSALIGASHIDPEQGIASLSYEQASLKTKMMGRASNIYVLADSTKMNDGGSPYWSAFPENWTLITDRTADKEFLTTLSHAGARNIVVA